MDPIIGLTIPFGHNCSDPELPELLPKNMLLVLIGRIRLKFPCSLDSFTTIWRIFETHMNNIQGQGHYVLFYSIHHTADACLHDNILEGHPGCAYGRNFTMTSFYRPNQKICHQEHSSYS